MDELIVQLKKEIIEVLNLEGITPDHIETDAPLFGEGLGLDSIDALEIIVLLEKNYGIKMDNPNEAKVVFSSVRTLADYVTKKRTK